MFIIVKKGLIHVSTPQLMGMRFFTMFLLVLPLVPRVFREFFVHSNWPRSTKKAMLWLPFLGTLLPVFAITLAQTSVGSGSTGLVHALGPLVALLIGVAFYQEIANRQRFLGLILGFAGVGLLVVGSTSARIEGDLWAFGLLLFALFCYGFASHSIRRYIQGLSVMAFPVSTFVVLAIPSVLMFIASDGWQAMRALYGTPSFGTVLFIVLMQAIVALVAHVCYIQCIGRRGASFALSVNYLVPIVALGWGFWDGESLSFVHFLCFALIGGGLFLANRQNKPL